ncbi:glycoside hydrolase family 47 protein [Suillus paluster]|uniref:glycoside hydrolase family 47 protein n=1 Tax=Suillus paluster TaxID=48578 RepID=UPI001B86D6EE|nr:glycoside hydrolase family 47 protein [Suillus paluster]KAG1753648.1 glycoside hydrolase family 47 protein [Suillus paluster]
MKSRDESARIREARAPTILPLANHGDESNFVLPHPTSCPLMASFRRWFLAALAASVVTAEQVQKSGLQLPASAAAHQEAVKDLFVTSYEAYQTYAWGHDDLLPISKKYFDGRNGWGASIADAMGTMWIMGLTDWFEKAVEHTANTNFTVSQTSDTVSLFETTIRYVGGFLSAYELSGEKYPVLVEKAQDLADQMAYAWVAANQSIPYGYIDFTDHQPTLDTSNIAEAGTLTLEWNRLSKHTGNSTYRELAEKSVQFMIQMPAPLPGMPAQGINPKTGDSIGGYVTWGGGSDSYFEYLIKYARLTNTDDNSYADAWLTAVDTSMKTLLRTSTVDDWLYLADYDDNKNIRHVGSHLACFYGGNWILGGKLTNNDTLVNLGLQLTDACWNTYASTATGIGPEVFAYKSSDGNYTGNSAPNQDQLDFYDKHGFYITSADYYLRPEVLESNFYAWRVTGDTKYLDNAASATSNFKKYLSTTVAYTGIWDVNNVDSTKIDDMESFWFAEVLKYLYLTFDDPDHISLDDWVFNTECHPFKAPPAKACYGSGNLVPSKPFSPESPISVPLPAISPIPALL